MSTELMSWKSYSKIRPASLLSTQYSVLITQYSSLITSLLLLNVDRAITNCKLERSSAGAGSSSDLLWGYAGLLARFQSTVQVFDFARTKNFSVEVAVKSCRKFDRQLASGKAHFGSHATPTFHRNIQVQLPYCYRCRQRATGQF